MRRAPDRHAWSAAVRDRLHSLLAMAATVLPSVGCVSRALPTEDAAAARALPAETEGGGDRRAEASGPAVHFILEMERIPEVDRTR
ncbi:MAG: hypothetical protein ACYS9X_32450, partial [Planctomycetota bacterium]